MRGKIFSIVVLIIWFLFFLIFLYPQDKNYYVKEIVSPCKIVMDTGDVFTIQNYDTFDANFTEHNKLLAQQNGLSEEEAFVIGNFARDWAENILKGRKVNISNNDLVYNKFGYGTRFENSPYCIKDGRFLNSEAAQKLIQIIKRTDYKLLNLETNELYAITKNADLHNCIVVRDGYKKIGKFVKSGSDKSANDNLKMPPNILSIKDIKIILTDMTTKIKPDNNCNTDICREILNNINKARCSIDIAIYGYSSVPAIEAALNNALQRGVKIRLVYDIDAKGVNIYENTDDLVKMIADSRSDKNSVDVAAIMHNKFYIFDDEIVITGSANLSHTDMSGYNSNVILVIHSPKIAGIYKTEFEQMYGGKFHSDKASAHFDENVYFSPQDKVLTRVVLPIISGAKNYIYVPAFLITEKRVTSELIAAKKRGVDVRIITDALNAASKYSKVRALREAGVPVKIENYAGKMHSKTIIADDKYLIIGSMNFSNSGENKNDENVFLLENAEAARFYKEFFLYLWNRIPDKWLKFYPRAESVESTGSCTDGIDNDYDGLIDSADGGCITK